MGFKDVIQLIRIKHWIKNIIIFIPMIFSLNIFEKNYLILNLICFLSFCFISSAVYIINDLHDIKKDKNHSQKKKRPIASGKITKKTAYIYLIILFILSLISALFINYYVLLIILLYFINNIIYTFFGKNFAIADVILISIGFILRILAGCAATDIFPSIYLILITIFISFFLTFAKRYTELNTELLSIRENLHLYNEKILNRLIKICAFISIILYTSFAVGIEVQKNIITLQKTQFFYFTAIPFALIILRLLNLINRNIESDPCDYFYNDKLLKILTAMYLIILILVITLNLKSFI